ALAGLEQRSAAAAEALEAAQAAVEQAAEQTLEAVTPWGDALEALRRDAPVLPLLRRKVEETQTRQSALVRSMGQLEARIEHLKKDVERANELREGLGGLKQEFNVAADLAQML